jgi:hypothetical protein
MQDGLRRRRGVTLSSRGILLAVLLTQSILALPTANARTNWPTPVAKFIERSERCMHFSGEFNGDGSARDAEVNHRMDALRCNSLPADLKALRKRYRADARITKRLGAFEEDGMPRNPETGL